MSKWKCEFCDYEANTERGLKIHKGHLHKGEVAPTPTEEPVKDLIEDPAETVGESKITKVLVAGVVPTKDATVKKVIQVEVSPAMAEEIKDGKFDAVSMGCDVKEPWDSEPQMSEIKKGAFETVEVWGNLEFGESSRTSTTTGSASGPFGSGVQTVKSGELTQTTPLVTETPTLVTEAPPLVTETPTLVTETPTLVTEDPTPVPQAVGVTTIPVGARLRLNGLFWQRNTVGNYDDMQATNLECRVYDKIEQNDFVYLQLTASDHTEWCCVESQVLDGTIDLLSLKDGANIMPKHDPKAQEAYFKACKQYTLARDAKLAAETEYKAVDTCTRPAIITYLHKYGQESDAGKRDHVLKDGGFDVHHTFAEGKVSIKRDQAKIIEWCTQNGHSYAIKPALDVEAWDALVAKGDVVPPEFLAQVHTPEKAKDNRRLLIKGTGIDSE